MEKAKAGGFALRLGLRQIDGLREDDIQRLVSVRENIPADLNPHLFAPPLVANSIPPLDGEGGWLKAEPGGVMGPPPTQSPPPGLLRKLTSPRGGGIPTCAICGSAAG